MPRRGYGLFIGDSCLSPGGARCAQRIERIPVGFPDALVFADLVQEHYQIESVPLRLSFSGRVCETRNGSIRGAPRNEQKSARITISKTGENVDTVIHELAHYVAYAKEDDLRFNHTPAFARRYAELVNLAKGLLY